MVKKLNNKVDGTDEWTMTRVRKSVLEVAKTKALAENRNVTNFIETLILSHEQGKHNRSTTSKESKKLKN